MKLTIANADLKQVVGCVADYTFGMDLTWDWPCGVAYYGISRAFEVTGEQAYLERMIQWCDEYIDAGLPGWTVNTCSMGHIFAHPLRTDEGAEIPRYHHEQGGLSGEQRPAFR